MRRESDRAGQPTADGPDRSVSDATGSGVGRPVTRRAALASLAAGGTVALAGCSAVSDAREAAGVGEVDPVWRRDLPAARAGRPAVASDGSGPVLVGAQDKAVHALAVEDGSETFRYETGGPVRARPVVPTHGDTYHVRSTDGDVYTLDRSGDLVWSDEGVDPGHLARVGSLLLTGDPGPDEWFAGRVIGRDAATGESRFARPVAGDWRTGVRGGVLIVRIPVPDTDRLRIAGVSPADGTVLWQSDASAAAGLVVDDTLAVAVRDDVVTAFEPADGHVRWRTPLGRGEYDGPLALGPLVYVQTRSTDSEGVVAMDRASGEVVWRWRRRPETSLRVIESGPDAFYPVREAVVQPNGSPLGGLFGGDDPDNVARISRIDRDGTRRWTTDLPTPLPKFVAVVDEAVVVANDRAVAAVERATGERRWVYSPDPIGDLRLAAGEGVVIAARGRPGVVVRLPTE